MMSLKTFKVILFVSGTFMSSQTENSSGQFHFYRLREIRQNIRISWLVLKVDGKGFYCSSFTAFPERADWPASDLISEDLYDAYSVVDSADNIKDTLDQTEKSRFFDTIDKAVEGFDPFTFSPSRASSPTAGKIHGTAVPGFATVSSATTSPSIDVSEANIKNQLFILLKQFNATKAEWVRKPAETKERVLWELVLK
jgi:hypothetical protein